MPSRISLLLFLIATTSGSALAGIDLGGPCEYRQADAATALRAELRNAHAAGDAERVVELHERMVRRMCGNVYRWLDLAVAYVEAGHEHLALEALREVHDRGFDLLAAGEELPPPLPALIDGPAFRESPLGVEIAVLLDAARRRQAGHAERIDALAPGSRPPEPFVARGACPFECCTYREWEVLQPTQLLDRPGGSRIVASLAAGTRAAAVTGEVHARPVPVVVLFDHPPFREGEILFLLDPLGEGVTRYWRHGETAAAEIVASPACLRPGRQCWAEWATPDAGQDPFVWWILIETAGGARGWTDRPEHFGNKDACG